MPSKEGLTIQSESSILYSITASKAPTVLKQTGTFYERDLILPVFRSAAADICSQYDAKDMHSSKRGEIEMAIRERMRETLSEKGFNIEAVLLKSISLPSRISNSIERKLEAEQEAMRMAFVTEQQKRDVERQIILEEGNRDMAKIKAEGQKIAAIIQAEGRKEAEIIDAEAEARAIELRGEAIKKYNQSVNSTLSSNLLKLKQIEAFEKLSTSSNAKVMMLDGKTPIMNMFNRD